MNNVYLLIFKGLKFLGIFLIAVSIYIIVIKIIKTISNLWKNVKLERNMMIDETRENFLQKQIVYQNNSATSKFARLCGFSVFFILGILFTLGNVFLALLLGILGVLVPKIYFKIKENKRLELFDKQLPRALTIMSNSLKSGSNIYQALEVVVEDLKPPLSEEFEKVIREVKLGASLSQSIENLSKRVNSKEMKFVSNSIILVLESGGKLAEVLDNVSKLMKEREKFNLRVKAMTTQGRMSAIVVGIMPLVIFVAMYSMQPDMMNSFIKTGIGLILMALAVVLVIIGLIVVRRIVEIKV